MSTVILPTTIPQYLAQLRAALTGTDPAVVQDALYDAEEYLRSEWAERPDIDEASLLASVAGSYGAPSEVAEIYRDTEATVSQALRAPPVRRHGSAFGKFFGVLSDPRAYTSLLYLLLSLATGVFYFTWAVTGVSLSIGLAALIVGIPFVVLFLASVRGLSLVEGRLLEAMLGERMPRRPLYSDRNRPVLERIKEMFVDPRTWSAMFYMILMMPLGVVYFTFAVVAISLAFGVGVLPLADHFGGSIFWFDRAVDFPLWSLPFTLAAGLLILVATLHAARGIGRVHAQVAKQMLTRASA